MNAIKKIWRKLMPGQKISIMTTEGNQYGGYTIESIDEDSIKLKGYGETIAKSNVKSLTVEK